MNRAMLQLTRLQVDKSVLDSLVAWYQTRFGMELRKTADTDTRSTRRLAFPNQPESSQLELSAPTSAQVQPYSGSGGDAYWKIGVAAPDVAGLRKRIVEKYGDKCSNAHQFGDIGFMSHTSDAAGFTIEMLQHDFEKNFKWKHTAEQKAGEIGQPLVIGQITLRVSDYKRSVAFYESLGMKLLSEQDVKIGGFNLYFLAFTDETPPDPDLKSVANREWLWARPYTTLELQHFYARDITPQLPNLEKESGFVGVQIQLGGAEHVENVRKALGDAIVAGDEKNFEAKDPDGIPLRFVWD